jgi:hypothetical protein
MLWVALPAGRAMKLSSTLLCLLLEREQQLLPVNRSLLANRFMARCTHQTCIIVVLVKEVKK